MQDLGVKIALEHLAVLFKSDNNVPFRAALKAKNLTCVLLNGGVPESEFCFFELSDIAATASIACER